VLEWHRDMLMHNMWTGESRREKEFDGGGILVSIRKLEERMTQDGLLKLNLRRIMPKEQLRDFLRRRVIPEIILTMLWTGSLLLEK